MSSFFFFFQAEDGIRAVAVTGVQTCALPISIAMSTSWPQLMKDFEADKFDIAMGGVSITLDRQKRSEERRVGKECRSRGSPYHEKKNNNEKKPYTRRSHKRPDSVNSVRTSQT